MYSWEEVDGPGPQSPASKRSGGRASQQQTHLCLPSTCNTVLAQLVGHPLPHTIESSTSKKCRGTSSCCPSRFSRSQPGSSSEGNFLCRGPLHGSISLRIQAPVSAISSHVETSIELHGGCARWDPEKTMTTVTCSSSLYAHGHRKWPAHLVVSRSSKECFMGNEAG